ncbi:MAG TPA: ABC transporter ATP-binding protein [Chloroflexi bacterium]|nr:ABC transporter ATP-binding protein [Chloroflexota bacterium]
MKSEFKIKGKLKTNKNSAIKWLISHAQYHSWALIGMIVPAFANAALAALVPLLIGNAFEMLVQSMPKPDYKYLLWAATMIVVSQVGRAIGILIRNISAELIGQRMERNTRDELYVSLIGKNMSFHDTYTVGDVMARATNDVREINLMFNPGLNLVIGSGSFLIMPIIFSWQINPVLILSPLVFLFLYVIALWQYLGELRPVSEVARRSFGELNDLLAQVIDGIETVKGAARETYETNRFLSKAREYRDAFVKQGWIEARFLPLLLMGLVNAFGFWHAVSLFESGLVNVGDVIAYMGLLSLFGFPVFVSLFSYSQVALGIAGARRMLELIRGENILDENIDGYTNNMLGQVRFENVSFGYTNGSQVVENLSFDVKPGQIVALVGQTGSGKSTILKLINRTYDVTSGKILVDNIDVCDWSLASLRKQISIIEQDLFLFSRSIAENISFGIPESDQLLIEKAARAAQAHDFIMEFKDGYNTIIGERGATLSGGQRQRLALARAFLTDPRILILDDSTSAIDSETEDQIQRAIRAASQGRTTFIITHRLSQIRWADMILVLKNGEIVDSGNHEKLINSSDLYKRIFSNHLDKNEKGDKV